MRLFAICVLLFLFCVQAQNMTARDAGGNTVTLQDEKCVIAPWLDKWKTAVFVYNGKTYASCWRIQNNEVVILDSGGDVTVLPPDIFRPETGV